MKKYLLSKAKSITAFFVFSFIFCLVGKLEQMRWSTSAYALLLCVFFGVLFLAYDYFRYREKLEALEQLRHSIGLGKVKFPAAGDEVERQYQEIMEDLRREAADITSRMDNEKTDMIDYYTMWVHQIKTPIAALGLIFQSEGISPSSDMSMELFKIEQYVEMALQYLRLGSEQTDYVIRDHNLDDIIKEVIHKYSPTFIKKKIGLEYNETDYRVLTDDKWLGFVLEQILSNALKYTVTGKISIYMDSEDKETLIIEDTGIGIQPEDVPRVFDRGFTGYNGRTNKKSTGIGLYLCNQVLKRLGFSMKIESQVGIGTKVSLHLPRQKFFFE